MSTALLIFKLLNFLKASNILILPCRFVLGCQLIIVNMVPNATGKENSVWGVHFTNHRVSMWHNLKGSSASGNCPGLGRFGLDEYQKLWHCREPDACGNVTGIKSGKGVTACWTEAIVLQDPTVMAFLFAWTCSQIWSSRTKYPNEYFSTTYWQILQGLSNHRAWKKYTPPLSSLACPSIFLHKALMNGRLNSPSIHLAGVSFELKQLYWQEGYWQRLQY